MKRFYVISPNVENTGDISCYLEQMFKDHTTLIGYSSESQGGSMFEKMKIGDYVICAQGSNDNKKVYYAGIVSSGSTKEWPYSRNLSGFTDLRNEIIPFNENNAYGNSSRIPAIYELKQSNKADYTICNLIKLKVNSMMAKEHLSQIIRLLVSNKNLILTGAPGTGKTYLAKEIAKEMGCSKEEMGFVQFHPSYDYTDFVEGLRPFENTDETIGFKLKDGVFKEFCKRAAKNLEDSKKTSEQLAKEKTLKEQYDEVLDDIENGALNEFQLKTGGKSMEVVKVSDFNNIILRTPGTSSQRTYTVSFDRLAKLAAKYPTSETLNNISNISDEVRGTIGGCNASAYWAVLKEVFSRNQSDQTESAPKVDRKNYVFIIDEINRGEASKIFGELFYAIDPGYRGETDTRVKTQYQNLVPDTDVFAEGFYVPENVYILATMNDIDRSVESMDFAMRRRFAFMEVTAEESMEMIHSKEKLDKSYGEIEQRMKNLNQCILTIQGLSPAYQIGAAYFLKLENYLENDVVTDSSWSSLWNNHLKGLLYEYLRGMPNAEEILNEQLFNAYSLKDMYKEENGKVVRIENDDNE